MGGKGTFSAQGLLLEASTDRLGGKFPYLVRDVDMTVPSPWGDRGVQVWHRSHCDYYLRMATENDSSIGDEGALVNGIYSRLRKNW